MNICMNYSERHDVDSMIEFAGAGRKAETRTSPIVAPISSPIVKAGSSWSSYPQPSRLRHLSSLPLTFRHRSAISVCRHRGRETMRNVNMISTLSGRAPSLVRGSSFNTLSIGRTFLSLFCDIPVAPCRGTVRRSMTGVATQVDKTIVEPISREDRAEPDIISSESPTETSIKDRLPSWLRPYQVDVIEACVNALDRGLQRIGVSSPTGSGKTVML